MSHGFHQNYGHLVFHVGNVTLRDEDIARLHAYIGGIAKQLRIENPVIGGTDDHIHLLGHFPVTRAVADIVREMKTSSSRWISGIHSCYADFSWNAGYGYFSVSFSVYPKVAEYIRTQREHHARFSTAEEYDKLVAKHTTS